jgi:hypothetical protein
MPFSQTQCVRTLVAGLVALFVSISAGGRPAFAQPAELPPPRLPATPADTMRADTVRADSMRANSASGIQPARIPHRGASVSVSRGTIAEALKTSRAPELDAPIGHPIVTEVEPDTVHVFTKAPPLWIGQPTLPEARDYENTFFRVDAPRPGDAERGPSPVAHPSGEDKPGPLPATLCPPAEQVELGDPEVFDRTPTMLPPGRVEYYYSAPDSVVHCAIYRWDETSHMSGMEFIRMMRRGGVQPATVLATYDVVFDEVTRYVSRRIGPPGVLDPSPRKIDDRRISYRREARWSTDDVVIDLRLSVNRVGGHLTVVQHWK